MSTPLRSCPVCHGLSPGAHTTCVHCDAALPRRRFARVARALAAGGALVTLMACYGMVARPMGPGESCGGDGDGDGMCAQRDCDDARADVYPGAADPDGDGVDQNCDGVDGWRDDAAVAVPPPAAEVPAPPAPTPVATDPPATSP